MCVRAESDARVAETEAEYLGESVSNFDMTTFARSRYRDFAESRGSESADNRNAPVTRARAT